MNLLGIYDSISVELEDVRELFATELDSDIPVVADMLVQVNKYRGKMLRPALVILCGKLCGRIQPIHHRIAAIAEMVHMATLVHDDVLDQAEIRRRGKTLNALHGNEAAVMLGDLLFSHAFRLCSGLDSTVALRLMAATAITLCEGELMQLYYRGESQMSEDRYFEIVERKTASLMGSCCYLGAYASKADESTCQAMDAYGRNLGIAFQIVDDLIDLAGDESYAGKSLHRDLATEKITLPQIHYLALCDQQERQRVGQMLKQQDTEAFHDYVQRMNDAGSIAYVAQTAQTYIDRACAMLPGEFSSDIHNMLRQLAAMVTQNMSESIIK